MTIPRFFLRVHAAVGQHLAVDPATLSKRLDAVTVAVVCGPEQDKNAAWTSELLVNLLARIYPRLCIGGDPASAARLRELASAINPQVELINDPAGATVIVATGPSPENALRAGAVGWTAKVGGSEDLDWPSAGPPNPFSAGAAAALAASAVFRKILLNDDAALSPASIDLLTFGTGSPPDMSELGPIDLGVVVIAGVGAVGNAALWALSRHANLKGSAIVIDPEVVELSNLQRYVLAMDSDVGAEKTVIAQRVLAPTQLDTTLIRGRLGEITLPDRIDRLLVTVDNVPGRRVAQALLPKLLVNGWTSESGLGASWHDFREGSACLACLYHPTGASPSQTELVARALGLTPERAAMLWVSPEQVNRGDADIIAKHLGAERSELTPWVGKRIQDVYTKLICGSAAISIGERGRLETVPLAHQSVLSGILAAAELVKRSDPRLAEYLPEQNLTAWHDVTRAPPQVWLQRRNQALGCFCSDTDYREVFAAKWANPQLTD